MVSDMLMHHDSAVSKDRLSDNKSHPASQTSPPFPHRSIAAAPTYENPANDQPESDTQQHRNQAKIIGKEDPMSHRIIEKRRRDRMNNCLADLSRLIPAEYMKKGRGRVEKTEIIEMAIKHMKYLQSNVSSTVECQPCETKQPEPRETEKAPEQTEKSILIAEQYKLGFFECLTETMQHLVEGHGYPPDYGLCLSLINHLQNHCAQIIKGKQVIHAMMKDEIMLKMERFNANMLVSQDVDGSYEETDGQGKKLSKSSKSQSQSSNSTSNEQTLADHHQCSMSYTTDSYSSHGSMYKFKTDIKQRFSAESSSGVESSSEYYTQDKKRRRKESSDCCATEDRPDEVPIFALHADGSYYIPLTINRDIISPMIDSVIGEDRSSVVVHPISISVNFQATANQF